MKKRFLSVFLALALCLGLGVSVGLVLGIGAYFGGPGLLGIYSGDPEVIAFGLRRMAIVCTCQCIGALMGNMVGVLRGLGASFVPMVITITFVCGFRVVWLYTAFAAVPTLEMLYVSYPITWGLAALVDFGCYFVVKHRVEKKLAASSNRGSPISEG